MSEQFGQEKAVALQALPSGTVLPRHIADKDGAQWGFISLQTPFLLWEGGKAKTCCSAKKSMCF